MRGRITWLLIGNLSLTISFSLVEILLVLMPGFAQDTANSEVGKLVDVVIGLYYIGTPILSGFVFFGKGLKVSTGAIAGLFLLGWTAHLYFWFIMDKHIPM